MPTYTNGVLDGSSSSEENVIASLKPLLAYNCEDGTGSTLTNQSSYGGNDGTLGGDVTPEWESTIKPFGTYSLKMPAGSSQSCRVMIATGGQFFSPSYSWISGGWFYGAPGSAVPFLFSRTNEITVPSGGVNCSVAADGNLRFLYDAGAGIVVRATTGVNVRNSAWHHLMWRYDHLNNTIWFYVDGVPVGSASTSSWSGGFNAAHKTTIGIPWAGSPELYYLKDLFFRFL